MKLCYILLISLKVLRNFIFPLIMASMVISLTTIAHAYAASSDPVAMIPEETIQKLVSETNQIDPKLSATRLRRVYKGTIRNAQSLLKVQPKAPNRYRVLHITMRLQQRLLSLDRSERTRIGIYQTCKLLADAPDQYAKHRLDADMILSDKELSGKGATFKERAVALRSLVQHYRETSAELKSLMIAMKVADQLHAFEDKNYYFTMIKQRFADNSRAIRFIREHSGSQRIDIIFAGRFTRNDGVALHFPQDRMGHDFIAVFWSKKDEGYEKFLSQLKNQQDRQPDRFEIYSFNLDNLGDAGASIVKAIGLRCSVMKLPGGKNSETFRTYALESPQAILINEFGRTISEPKQEDQGFVGYEGKLKERVPFAYTELLPSNARYQMQLQSLLNGDFFAQDDKDLPVKGSALPIHVMSDILPLIPSAPFRYRLTPEAAFKNYSKIEALSSAAIEQHSVSPELWRVRNYRIIALMGIWRHTRKPKYLEKAVTESRALLSKELPAEATMLARYCLAMHALREGLQTKKKIITNFVEELGGVKASALAHAAASVLALGANAVDLHEHYRTLFLESGSESPYSVLSFLRNRHHRLYLFKGGRGTLREDRYAINNDILVPNPPFPPIKLKKLDGSERRFPGKGRENMTVVVFLEPPADGSLTLSPTLYKLPKKVEPVKKVKAENKNDKMKKSTTKRQPGPPPSGRLYQVMQLADNHVNKNLDVILAFLSDDLEQVKALNEKYNFPCEVVLVPAGLNNPIVRSLDIFNADRISYSVLVRRDGSIPWQATGFRYHASGRIEYQNLLALRNHIYRSDMEAGYQALKNRDYTKAKVLFSGPYISKKIDLKDMNRPKGSLKTGYHKWPASQHYGKAVAYIGLGEWDEALMFIDKAKLHHTYYFRHNEDKPCNAEIGMHESHALILDNLGRKMEARKMRSKALIKPTDYPTVRFISRSYDRPYEEFDKKLGRLKVGQPGKELKAR